MPIDLFSPQIAATDQHMIFQMISENSYGPERAVLTRWAEGFQDRDGKFVRELQTTFESSFWELYLFAALKEWGLPIDLRHHAPDFVVEGPVPFCLEATIANPPAGGQPAHGFSMAHPPRNFTDFNIESTLRICNSFDAKVRKYRSSYLNHAHVQDKPFVIGIASFDRPHSHFAAGRPILAALYGLYHDEAATRPGDTHVPSYNVTAAPKNANTNIDVGLFCDEAYADVSAVVYSCLATWGKLRALADDPVAPSMYTTIHPNPGSLFPIVRNAWKREYSEHLMDGLYVLHNPFAKKPLPPGLLGHPRLCEVTVADDGELIMNAPDDFLLLRMIKSIKPA
ncbi:glycosaminoglycan attachment site [Pseudomonas sp. PDM26]|uniref:glycosaminoglycan attachment site n=1 Tax=Pseudomonas sp. PDM26 TaxID=2854766 RepID=UPI001C4857FA|nr:glycosaminoglycan attachment site [Pseudomonas sp. PDM26]MBV7549869.1 glycosaminoglycan attachment site [Pseudomonas sp. PDM26]